MFQQSSRSSLTGLSSKATPARTIYLRSRTATTTRKTTYASSNPLDNPLFNDQFKAIISSTVQNDPTALTDGPPQTEEYKTSASEDVLGAALQQSKHTMTQMLMWRDMLDKSIVAQQKQIERIHFVLSKVRGDYAQLKVLKGIVEDQYGSDKDGD